eukprot:scaffold808_cov196-Alexandrium_tamarense.AAC.51
MLGDIQNLLHRSYASADECMRRVDEEGTVRVKGYETTEKFSRGGAMRIEATIDPASRDHQNSSLSLLAEEFAKDFF